MGCCCVGCTGGQRQMALCTPASAGVCLPHCMLRKDGVCGVCHSSGGRLRRPVKAVEVVLVSTSAQTP